MSKIAKLEKMLDMRKISRRQFLAGAAAFGAASTLPGFLGSNFANAATPQKGGRLRLGIHGAGQDDVLGPLAGCCAEWELSIQFQMRNCLVELDASGNPVPELAESWESSPDALHWIFKIRRGVEFHNGKSLDAKDVVYSLNIHRDKQFKSPALPTLKAIKEVKADGKYDVVIELESSYADLPSLMSDYHLQIVPEGHDEWDQLLGTGGYILKEFEPGVRVLASRNPNYWKEGRAHFEEIETIGITDVTARTSALKTGAIDLMIQPDVRTLHLLAKTPGIQVIEVNAQRHYTLPMLSNVAPFDNNDARLALKYAIDREELVKKILGGHGRPGNDNPICEGYRNFDPNLPMRTYDPEKARYHLKKAGLENHIFKLYAADAAFMGAVDTALLIQESARRAGINIEVVKTPNDGYWSDVWRKKPWCFTYWEGRPNEDMILSIAYAADAPWNDANWKHEKFNSLLREARSELDVAKRREMYTEIQSIIRNEGSVIVPMFTNHLMAASSKLEFGKPLAGNYALDGQRCTEKWWFAA